MVDVVLRKASFGNGNPSREWALCIRDFSSGVEVEWTTICFMDDFTARQITGERITFWDGDDELKAPAKELRLEHPSLREAWDNYKVLKELFSKK